MPIPEIRERAIGRQNRKPAGLEIPARLPSMTGPKHDWLRASATPDHADAGTSRGSIRKWKGFNTTSA